MFQKLETWLGAPILVTAKWLGYYATIIALCALVEGAA